MTQKSNHPNSQIIEGKLFNLFIDSIRGTRSSKGTIEFINDLLTPMEKVMLSKRLAIALLIIDGNYTYEEIHRRLRVSRGTISKIAMTLALQGDGFRKQINKISRKKEMKNSIEELFEIITFVPPKGTNWSEWRKTRYAAKRRRLDPF
jgi:uncharacterized protein YerC